MIVISCIISWPCMKIKGLLDSRIKSQGKERMFLFKATELNYQNV